MTFLTFIAKLDVNIVDGFGFDLHQTTMRWRRFTQIVRDVTPRAHRKVYDVNLDNKPKSVVEAPRKVYDVNCPYIKPKSSAAR